MNLVEKKMDLFTVDKEYYLAHCVSADYALGAGIAVEFNNRYNMREELKKIGRFSYPDAVVVDNVYNLVTKEKYWHKPTYFNLESALLMARRNMVGNGIKKLAMPRIGSGLDKLEWDKVKVVIERVFKDTDIEILVCTL